jgi:hypothetical protein
MGEIKEFAFAIDTKVCEIWDGWPYAWDWFGLVSEFNQLFGSMSIGKEFASPV